LKVDFDFSFPEIACNLLSLDAVDDTGAPQRDAVHEIYKHKLSTLGKPEGKPMRHSLGDSLISEKQLADLSGSKEVPQVPAPTAMGCGNCYGAGAKGQCCNTCDEVRVAYEKIGWHFKPQGIAQCASEAFLSNLKDQFAEDGGCQVRVVVVIDRVVVCLCRYTTWVHIP
jgi:hypothetical protein